MESSFESSPNHSPCGVHFVKQSKTTCGTKQNKHNEWLNFSQISFFHPFVLTSFFVIFGYELHTNIRWTYFPVFNICIVYSLLRSFFKSIFKWNSNEHDGTTEWMWCVYFFWYAFKTYFTYFWKLTRIRGGFLTRWLSLSFENNSWARFKLRWLSWTNVISVN